MAPALKSERDRFLLLVVIVVSAALYTTALAACIELGVYTLFPADTNCSVAYRSGVVARKD
jgi:hypothetical protein